MKLTTGLPIFFGPWCDCTVKPRPPPNSNHLSIRTIILRSNIDLLKRKLSLNKGRYFIATISVIVVYIVRFDCTLNYLFLFLLLHIVRFDCTLKYLFLFLFRLWWKVCGVTIESADSSGSMTSPSLRAIVTVSQHFFWQSIFFHFLFPFYIWWQIFKQSFPC